MPTPHTPPRMQASKRVERSLVRIDRDAAGVRVIFSMASAKGSVSNRTKVLERARRMLAAAIEEEQRREAQAGNPGQDETIAGPAPGTGAWWSF